MKQGEYPYLERSIRLRKFFADKNFKNNTAFANALGIPQQHIAGYLDGRRNPMTICEQLREIGMDLNWLATGVETNEETTGISYDDKRILDIIKSNSFDIDKLKEAIELYQFAHRKDQPKKEIKQLTAADMMDASDAIFDTDESRMIRHRHIRNADTARKHKDQ